MTSKFKLIDRITLIYIFISIIYMMIGWDYVINPLEHITVFLIIAAVLILLIIFGDKIKIIGIIHRWFPLVIFGYFFEATTYTNRVVFHDYLDPFFQMIDQWMFGYQPAKIWGQQWDIFFIQELFHFAYFSYYIMIAVLAIHYYKKRNSEFDRYVYNLSFVFVACYITYNILPVIGGRYWQETLELTKLYRHGIFTRIMAFIYNNTEHWGGAFPSSHVAISLTVFLSAWRSRYRWSGVLLALTILLSISTVYCHYHYFIDIIGGAIYGLLFFHLSNYVFDKKRC